MGGNKGRKILLLELLQAPEYEMVSRDSEWERIWKMSSMSSLSPTVYKAAAPTLYIFLVVVDPSYPRTNVPPT